MPPGAGSAPATGKDLPEDESADAAATIAQLRARVAELEDLWRRTAADLENVRKRAARRWHASRRRSGHGWPRNRSPCWTISISR